MQELKWYKINNGFGTGISIFTSEEYFNVYANNGIDVEMMDDIKKEFPNNFNIFDVGMFIGLSSMIFAKICGDKGTVVGFEPNPYNCERIKINLEKNDKLSKKIKLEKYALSNNNEKVEMNLSSVIEGPSSTSRLEGTHPSISDNQLPDCFKKELVQTYKLDDVINDINVVPDIIKIDIEGAEHLMLMGAIETIKKYHPIIYIEMHSQFCTMKCMEILTALNYSFDILTEEEDNRIMVKAKYYEGKTDMQKYLDVSSIEINQLNLEKNIKNTFNLINEKFDNIEKKYNDFEKILKENYDNLEKNLKENYDSLEKSIMEKYDNLEEKIKVMETKFLKEVKSLKTINASIKEQNQLRMKELNAKIENIENSYNQVINSNSWKITKPLRVVSEKIHKK